MSENLLLVNNRVLTDVAKYNQVCPVALKITPLLHQLQPKDLLDINYNVGDGSILEFLMSEKSFNQNSEDTNNPMKAATSAMIKSEINSAVLADLGELKRKSELILNQSRVLKLWKHYENLEREDKTVAGEINLLKSLEVSKDIPTEMNKSDDSSTAIVNKQNSTRYKCYVCDVKFKATDQLERHAIEEHKFTCDTCKVSFNLKKNLKFHIANMHFTRVKKFKCTKCDMGFNVKSNYKRHVLMHHGKVKVSKCNQCDREFYLKSDLKSHQKYFHKNEEKLEKTGDKGKSTSSKSVQPFKCGICHRHFGSMTEYKIHINEMHMLDSASFECDKCHKQYSYKRALEKHVESEHTNFTF